MQQDRSINNQQQDRYISGQQQGRSDREVIMVSKIEVLVISSKVEVMGQQQDEGSDGGGWLDNSIWRQINFYPVLSL